MDWTSLFFSLELKWLSQLTNEKQINSVSGLISTFTGPLFYFIFAILLFVFFFLFGDGLWLLFFQLFQSLRCTHSLPYTHTYTHLHFHIDIHAHALTHPYTHWHCHTNTYWHTPIHAHIYYSTHGHAYLDYFRSYFSTGQHSYVDVFVQLLYSTTTLCHWDLLLVYNRHLPSYLLPYVWETDFLIAHVADSNRFNGITAG